MAPSLQEGTEYRARDLDQIVETIGGLLRPYRVSAGRGPLDAGVRYDRVGSLVFITSDYGSDIDIDVESPGSFYVLSRALTGRFSAKSLGPERGFTRAEMHVINPVAPVHMRLARDCRLAITRLERATIDAHLAALTGEAPTTARAFPEAIGAGPLRRYFDLLYDESRRAGSPLRDGHGARFVEQTLTALLCETLTAPPRHEVRCGPYYVKRAEEFMVAHLADDIGIADIAEATGVSVRALYYGFRRFRDATPMAWLKERRLERARELLLAADPEHTTVTQVSLGLGFLHHGRFSAAYRERFGEPPLSSLRRR